MAIEESIRPQEISNEEISKKKKPVYKRVLASIWYTLLVVLLLFAIPSIYFSVVYYPIYISGTSMSPTLANNEFGLMDQRANTLKNLKRGEIIIINRSANETPDLIIKRIIALPGETIELTDNSPRDLVRITPVVGEPFFLDEVYLDDSASSHTVNKTNSYSFGPAIEVPLTLSATEYYVMGDNRPNSTDSRSGDGLGPVFKGQITGKLVYIQGTGRVNGQGDFGNNKYYYPWDWRKY